MRKKSRLYALSASPQSKNLAAVRGVRLRLRWRAVGPEGGEPDALRSQDGRYWVTRAPSSRWPAGRVYTAAHEPEGRPAVHLGCYGTSVEAVAACNRHAELSLIGGQERDETPQ